MDNNTNPAPMSTEFRLEISQWQPVLKLSFIIFAAPNVVTTNAAKMIASQTVLVFVKKMQTTISVIATRLIIRQIPEVLKATYSTNGNIRNNTEAKRFLCAIVA